MVKPTQKQENGCAKCTTAFLFFEKNRLRILHNADSQTVLVIHKFHLQLL